MNQIDFHASVVSLNRQDGTLLIAFGDDKVAPQQYLILQRALTIDNQDKILGQDTFHFEYSDPSFSGYGGIERVILTATNLKLVFLDSNHWRPANTMSIDFELNDMHMQNLAAELRVVFEHTETDFTADI